jgi:hypothetical protein
MNELVIGVKQGMSVRMMTVVASYVLLFEVLGEED